MGVSFLLDSFNANTKYIVHISPLLLEVCSTPILFPYNLFFRVETGNNAEKQELVKDKPVETENKPSKKEEKKDKQTDTKEMLKNVVNKDTVQKVDDESIKDEEPRLRG